MSSNSDMPSDDDTMIPNRPYLLRALHEWIIDNQMTPHILVDALAEGIKVPPSTIRNGKVVLNVDPSAVHELEITNTCLSCSARFEGRAFQLYIPIGAILAIYARENGRGMMFAEEEGFSESFDGASSFETHETNQKSATKDRSHLQLIK